MIEENKKITPDSNHSYIEFNKNPKVAVATAKKSVSDWDYFKYALIIICITLFLIALLGVIAVCSPNRSTTALILIKEVLNPFLTLMIGYAFGTGFNKKIRKKNNS